VLIKFRSALVVLRQSLVGNSNLENVSIVVKIVFPFIVYRFMWTIERGLGGDSVIAYFSF